MTQKRYKIKKGDYIEVIAGKEKGKRGEIVKVRLDDGKVIVGGLNMVTRFAKPSHANPDGAFRKEMPLDISNVSLIDPSTDKPGRVGVRVSDLGAKERYFKKTGQAVSSFGA